MNISMPITKKRIVNHFQYFWWVYLLLLVIGIFGWNLIHTVTRYQSPPHLKVEWYFAGYQLDDGTGAETLMDKAHQEALPEMEEVSYRYVMLDEMNGDMMLTTWVFAGEGDLYALPKEKFRNLAQSGSMMNLQPYVDSGALNLDGIDLTDCYVTEPESGEEWLCGIPMNVIPGLEAYGLYGDDTYLSVLINGGNDDNTIKLLSWLLETCKEPVAQEEPAAVPAA